jgi:alpha-1,2-glucosyltransferase
LLAYYYQLKSNFKLSAVLGAVSIFYRQTNVVWLAFCMCQLILLNAENLVKHQNIELLDKQIKQTTLPSIGQLQRGKRHSTLFELLIRKPSEGLLSKDFEIKSLPHKLFRDDFWGKKLIYSDLFKCLDVNGHLQPYVVVLTTFLFFVCVNNGIVVGDRSMHQASFHVVQFFYFLVFACFFNFSSFVFNLKKLKSLVNFIADNKLLIGLFVPVCCLVVANFTYEHPFLLADNRHFTFYIWSRLFKRFEIFRYALTFVYVACGYLFYRNLTLTGKSLGWLVSFSACLFIGLVPQKIIEFRYFIIPFYIYRLNIVQLSWKELCAEFAFYAVINYLTIELFVNRVFYWENSPQEAQRFMW